MLGSFQQSNLRVEVDASELRIRQSLLYSDEFRNWMPFQQISSGLPEQLSTGTVFTSWLGPLAIRQEVDVVTSNSLRLILSQGIDGFHQWNWGEGWVQSSLEGVSVLPLGLGQTLSLLRLRQYLSRPLQEHS